MIAVSKHAAILCLVISVSSWRNLCAVMGSTPL
jgi:hypothetical protein